jgi:twitching motility protein PilT
VTVTGDSAGNTSEVYAESDQTVKVTPQGVVSEIVRRGFYDEVSLITLLGEARHHLTLAELERALAREAKVSDHALTMMKSEISGYLPVPAHRVRPRPKIPAQVSRATGAVVISLEPLVVAMVEDLPESIELITREVGPDFEIQVCTISRFTELFRAAYEQAEIVDRPELTDIYEIFDEAIRLRASDIHLSVGSPPTMRADGRLKQLPLQNVDSEWMRSEIARIAGIERLARLETRHDVDMAFPYGSARFRVNFGADRNGFTIAARKIPSRIPTADEIGLPQSLQDLAHLDRGLVLVTGPTGSGKSTTLAVLLAEICRRQNRHVITLEDPIEFLLPDGKSMVNQRELGTSFTSFADGLRQALRQDPDVILVGEMRDQETIKTALTAAETGHLVFGTLHTYDSASTLARIVGVFPPEEQEQVRSMLGYIMKAIVSQTLLPNASGSGRSAAFELMLVNAAIANNLRRVDGQAQLRQIIETSSKEGMQTMDMALVDLVRRRLVTEEVAVEKAFNREDFYKRLNGN